MAFLSVQAPTIVDSFQYAEKSNYAKALDWFTLPLRTVFHGRNIEVLSATYQANVYETARWVASFAITVICIPLTVIGCACLLLKSITSYRHEKQLMKGTLGKLNDLELFSHKADSTGILALLKEHPRLTLNFNAQRSLTSFVTCMSEKGKGDPLGEPVQQVLQHMPPVEAIPLIDYSISRKISEADGRWVDADLIIAFIRHSLKSHYRECFDYLKKEHRLAPRWKLPENDSLREGARLSEKLYHFYLLDKIRIAFNLEVPGFHNAFLRAIDPQFTSLSEISMEDFRNSLLNDFRDYFLIEKELKEYVAKFQDCESRILKQDALKAHYNKFISALKDRLGRLGQSGVVEKQQGLVKTNHDFIIESPEFNRSFFVKCEALNQLVVEEKVGEFLKGLKLNMIIEHWMDVNEAVSTILTNSTHKG